MPAPQDVGMDVRLHALAQRNAPHGRPARSALYARVLPNALRAWRSCPGPHLLPVHVDSLAIGLHRKRIAGQWLIHLEVEIVAVAVLSLALIKHLSQTHAARCIHPDR